MQSSRPKRYVLGVGLSHDGSACLLKDGRVCVAIEKERITRFKHDGGNDNAAVQYCLDAEGISIQDIEVIVQNANFGMLENGNSWYQGVRVIKDHPKIVSISHHLAHAYGALGTSPFEDAAVLVIDGCGNNYDHAMDMEGAIVPETPTEGLGHLYHEKDSFYEYRNGKFRTVFKDFSQWGHVGDINDQPNLVTPTTLHSIGGIYSAFAAYIFRGMDDPGKLMGLAPFGREGAFAFPIFELKNERVFVRQDWQQRFREPAIDYADFKNRFQYFADIACWIQGEIERALVYIIENRKKLIQAENLVYAGGVALNAMANSRIRRETGFKGFYAMPAAGDNGLAIGCAFYGWLKILNEKRVMHNGSAYFGRSYTSEQISGAIRKHAGIVRTIPSPDVCQTTANFLNEGKVVGWFQGGSEFGPRALGNRSILADARASGMQKIINSDVKLREDFRPFAPTILAEDAATYFECDCESPYMLMVFPVREAWRQRIPNVVHKNNSARIQTLTGEFNPKYFELLTKFKQMTGVSTLLNTSFNRRGMPIVETPEEAIEFFIDSELDVLVLGDHVLQKDAEIALARLFETHLRPRIEAFVLKQSDNRIFELKFPNHPCWTVDLRQRPPQVFRGSSAQSTSRVFLSPGDLRRISYFPDDAYWLLQEARIKVDGDAMALVRLLQIFGLNPTWNYT